MKNLIKNSLSAILVMWAIIMLTMVGKTMGQTPTLSVHLSVDSIQCYGQNNGMIITIVNGGTNPYAYLWNTVPPQTTIMQQTFQPVHIQLQLLVMIPLLIRLILL